MRGGERRVGESRPTSLIVPREIDNHVCSLQSLSLSLYDYSQNTQNSKKVDEKLVRFRAIDDVGFDSQYDSSN